MFIRPRDDLPDLRGHRGAAAEEISQRLIGLAAHPTLSRALLGLEPLVSDLPDRERLADDVDLDAIGRVARAMLLSG